MTTRLKRIVSLLGAMLLMADAARAGTLPPERVSFPSADGKTTLVGYLFKPAGPGEARFPGVVLMHGRGGAYSTKAGGVYDASTLSKRHQAWGRDWAEAGYIAVLVDGFGPRGYAQGFPRFSYEDRPAELNEVTIRPLDAYGALAYLKSRPDVAPERIGLMGWSNGGSATLAAMDSEWKQPQGGFRAALAFYPACGLKDKFESRALRPYAPVLVLHGTDDEEVSHKRCLDLVEASQAAGGPIEIELFDGATHSFDSPVRSRQSLPANAEAREQAREAALAFFAEHLKAEGQPAGERDASGR